MGRKSLKEDRQKEIINAFYRVASKEGVENASLAKIAKECGMLPSMLIHYFSTKDELLSSLIDFILENYKGIYKARTKRNVPPLEQLIEILNSIFSRKWNRLIDDGVFYSCFALVFRDKQVRERYYHLHQLLRKWLADVITECKEDLKLTTEPEKAADLIFVISDGAYYYLSMVEDKSEYEKKLNRYKLEAFKILNLDESLIAKYN